MRVADGLNAHSTRYDERHQSSEEPHGWPLPSVIVAPDEQVADLRHRVGGRRAEQAEEAQRRGAVRAGADVRARARRRSTSVPVLLERVDDGAGDRRRAPRPTRCAPSGPRRARRRAAAGSARATASTSASMPQAPFWQPRGLKSGRPGLDARVRRLLLLAPHHAVLHVEVPGAAGHAVRHRVRAAHDAVPGPLRGRRLPRCGSQARQRPRPVVSSLRRVVGRSAAPSPAAARMTCRRNRAWKAPASALRCRSCG